MVSIKKIVFNSGFTLMELMIVIAIIGIMSAIAIPNIIGWLPDYRLRSATSDIVSCLQEAKLRAVKENDRVVVIFNQFNEAYTAFIDNVPAGGNWALDGTETIVRQETMPTGIDILNSITVGFNNRGLCVSGAGSVVMQNNNSNFSRVIVNLAGNIRAQMSSDGITWN